MSDFAILTRSVEIEAERYELLRRLAVAANELPYVPVDCTVAYVNAVLAEHVEANAAKLKKIEAARFAGELEQDRSASRRMESA